MGEVAVLCTVFCPHKPPFDADLYNLSDIQGIGHFGLHKFMHPSSTCKPWADEFPHGRRSALTTTCWAATPSSCPTMSPAANSGHYVILRILMTKAESKFRFRCYRTPGFDSIWGRNAATSLSCWSIFWCNRAADIAGFLLRQEDPSHGGSAPRNRWDRASDRRKLWRAEHACENALRSMVWERNVSHSIMPEIGDGFLLPYRELLDLAQNDPDFDLQPFVLHAPDERLTLTRWWSAPIRL